MRSCVICRRHSSKTNKLRLVTQRRVTPNIVFENVGVDYAGPISVKYAYVCKPTVIKSYVCVFVSLSVKAVHLELVSVLTTDACLRTRRGKPKSICSDHKTNFVRAFFEFLQQQITQTVIFQFCTISENTYLKELPTSAGCGKQLLRVSSLI